MSAEELWQRACDLLGDAAEPVIEQAATVLTEWSDADCVGSTTPRLLDDLELAAWAGLCDEP